MRQLARTLLILGSVGACERAHPVVDSQERPAVGNIGQTGRPQAQPASARPAAIAQPLQTPTGVPAVGNIGQTGAPAPIAVVPKPARRVQRAQRAAATRLAVQPTLVPERTVERPLVNRVKVPMTGNVMSKGGAPKHERLGFQATDASAVTLQRRAETPLVDRYERPASGNMGRRANLSPSEETLANTKRHIERAQTRLRDAATEEERRLAQEALDQFVIMYKRQQHALLQQDGQ